MKLLGTTLNNVPVYEHITASHSHRPDLDAEVISRITLEEGTTFFRSTVDMERVIGTDHLVETDCRDICIMVVRGNRKGPSRLVLTKRAQPTTKVTIVLCVDREELSETFGKWCLVTLFEGEQGEREPWDPSLKTEEAKVKAELFWAAHALVPTEQDLSDIEKLMPLNIQLEKMDDYEEAYMSEYEITSFGQLEDFVDEVRYGLHYFTIDDKNNNSILDK